MSSIEFNLDSKNRIKKQSDILVVKKRKNGCKSKKGMKRLLNEKSQKRVQRQYLEKLKKNTLKSKRDFKTHLQDDSDLECQETKYRDWEIEQILIQDHLEFVKAVELERQRVNREVANVIEQGYYPLLEIIPDDNSYLGYKTIVTKDIWGYQFTKILIKIKL